MASLSILHTEREVVTMVREYIRRMLLDGSSPQYIKPQVLEGYFIEAGSLSSGKFGGESNTILIKLERPYYKPNNEKNMDVFLALREALVLFQDENNIVARKLENDKLYNKTICYFELLNVSPLTSARVIFFCTT